MNLKALLAKIVTPGFITFNAHCFFAAFVVQTAIHAGANRIVVCSIAAALAAAKEFYVDKHFEANQSFLANLKDYAGYLCGIALGAFV